MKKMIKATALTIALTATALSAQAADIAVLDMQVVMNETKMAKEKQAELRAKSQKAQERLIEMDKSFNNRVEALKSKKSILSEEKYREEQTELRRVNQEMQAEAQKIQESLAQEHQSIQVKIADELDTIVSKMAKSKGFDTVLAKSYVLYSAKSIDITGEVLKELDDALNEKKTKKGL